MSEEANPQERREGRGRLSSIEMLPEDAGPDIIWALDQLNERRLPQNTILMEFNERLADKGIAPISKSAWSRYSVRKAIEYRKMAESRLMAAELNALFDPQSADEVTKLLIELMKVGLQDVLMSRRQLTTKEFMESARTLQALMSAQKGSTEHRRSVKEQERADAAKLVKDIGTKAGVSKEALEEINRRLMGGA